MAVAEERSIAAALDGSCQRPNVVILANDPDADRLAVAELVWVVAKDQTVKTWTVFTGDQIGVLLGHWLWTQFKDKASDGGDDSNNKKQKVLPVSMCCSTVSSQMLAISTP